MAVWKVENAVYLRREVILRHLNVKIRYGNELNIKFGYTYMIKILKRKVYIEYNK